MIHHPALQHAVRLLDAGNAEASRLSAQRVLRDAVAQADILLEARALSHLGHCDRVVSRFRRAHDAAQRAALLFRKERDACGEAFALSTVSYAASSLARNEDAVEAALLAAHLSSEIGDAQLTAVANNNLGIAYFWCRRFDKAQDAFDLAIATARASGSELSAFQPLMNLACAESWRLCSERFLTGEMPGAERLRFHVDAAIEVVGSVPPSALMGGMLVTSKAIIALFSAFADCWAGDIAAAERGLEEALSWASRFKTVTWLNALERWIRAEICLARGEVQVSVPFLADLIEVASEVEHEQLACVGHMLLAQAYERQGAFNLAVAELRKLRRREFQIRAESLDSREKVAQWQLELRLSSQRIESLQASSSEFERLSLEDVLTGIANRRHVECKLAELLRASDQVNRPLSVVFVDVDKFKLVNDTFSHRVGDQVLTRIAKTLESAVRDGDIAARLAGDEFVLVLPNTSLAEASAIAERLRMTVADLDWLNFGEGLQVTVSAGAAQALSDDTVEALLNRSDVQMYSQRRSDAGRSIAVEAR